MGSHHCIWRSRTCTDISYDIELLSWRSCTNTHIRCIIKYRSCTKSRSGSPASYVVRLSSCQSHCLSDPTCESCSIRGENFSSSGSSSRYFYCSIYIKFSSWAYSTDTDITSGSCNISSSIISELESTFCSICNSNNTNSISNIDIPKLSIISSLEISSSIIGTSYKSCNIKLDSWRSDTDTDISSGLYTHLLSTISTSHKVHIIGCTYEVYCGSRSCISEDSPSSQ